MRLKEFIDKNGNKVNLPKTGGAPKSSSGTSSGGFKKRFEKLIDYATKHRYSKITKVEVTKLTEDTLEFAEYYDGGAIVDYKIYIGPTTEAWHVEAFTTIINAKDREKVDDLVGTGWPELLKSLRPYITIPVATTPEYKDLMFEDSKDSFLKEFVDAKGNKVNIRNSSSNSSAPVTKSNKEKFEELIKYMEKYEVPYTTKMETIQLDNTCFKYNISVKSPGIKEYVVTLEVDYSRFNSSWSFVVYRNSDYIDDSDGKGWEELLRALSTSKFGNYANIPKSGSKEYESLTESTSIAEEFKTYENLWD
jgi:hypothetical protein